MSIESLVSIVSGELPINEAYKEVKELEAPKEETLKERLEQVLENYKESNVEPWRLSMGCGKVLLSLAVPLHLERDAISDKKRAEDKEAVDRYNRLSDQINLVVDTVEIFYKKNINRDKGNWETVLSGFTAEIACAISLKQGGFEVYMPSEKDDKDGKIDLLVFNNSDNLLIPVQIKSSSLLKDAVIEKVSQQHHIKAVTRKISDKWNEKFDSCDTLLIDSSKKKLQEMVSKTTSSCKGLLDYLEPVTSESYDMGVVPIIVAIPGGESEEALYNSRTGSVARGKGEPTSYLSNILYDNILEICDEYLNSKKYKEGHSV